MTLKRKNLNEITKRHTDASNIDPKDRPQHDYSIKVSDEMNVESVFKNLNEKVIEKIQKADAVVGCVAWLTDKAILRSLSQLKNGVSILIQKEDFLRPDLNTANNYIEELRELYSQLNSVDPNKDGQFEEISAEYGEPGNCSIDLAIRCVGYAKEPGEATLPRMHHKFLVFCRYDEGTESFWNLIPYAVWTGSYNMTRNGTKSLENAIYIENDTIANSYFHEWYNVLMISESLDWKTTYSAPDIQFNNLACLS